MQTCKLCLEEAELRRSHIIPEFMYSGIYDQDPKRFYEIKIESEETKSSIQQKGQREYLLCGKCESKLSKYEKYADENLYGKNNNGKTVLVNASMTQNGRVFLYEFEGFDYTSMKLFLDSLLWRLMVSQTIATPEYSDEIKEKLRISLNNEAPLNEDEFPCIIQSIMTSPGEILKGFILSPREKKHEKRIILGVLIDGYEYNFYVSKELPNDPIKSFLQKNGKLNVIGRLIYDMPDLIEIVKERMDHLKLRLKK